MFASSAEARASLLADQLTLELRPELWAKLMRTHGVALRAHFTSENYSAEDPTIERVFLAALRAASPEQQNALRKQLHQRTDELLARSARLADPADAGLPYPVVHRFGMLLQAILSQNGTSPKELPDVPTHHKK